MLRVLVARAPTVLTDSWERFEVAVDNSGSAVGFEVALFGHRAECSYANVFWDELSARAR